ncbi:hypothetical protein SAMN04489712_12715 [Thermomonospora echinospora]|uniref:MinD-like ATPase involved in chromosome partitioning or flagellar assembly n=1 Tax=Thermomonospora echinospora TaxID=1992 RepID=A0A1H6DZD0_9ACTN|nr:hypothetical protein [Thermomonospora echinospora]SEG90708.1 hypothetical protein SAMN04489712_12715 [Thermomonospora echinospora]
MALIALAADKGAPGVTTAAVALGAVWPRPVLVAECDQAGGDLVYRLPASDDDGRHTAMLNPSRGLLSLAATARRGLRPEQIGEHCQRLVGGLDVLVGITSAEQAQGMTWLWGPLGRAFAGLAPVDVLADCGRLGAGSPLLDLMREADMVVLLCRATLEQVAHLRERVTALAKELPGGPPIGIVVLADPRDFRGSIAEVDRIVAGSQLPATVLGGFALDPKGAEMLRGRWGGRLDRSLLIRSAREVAGNLVGRLAASPRGPQPADRLAGPFPDDGPAPSSGARNPWPPGVPHPSERRRTQQPDERQPDAPRQSPAQPGAQQEAGFRPEGLTRSASQPGAHPEADPWSGVSQPGASRPDAPRPAGLSRQEAPPPGVPQPDTARQSVPPPGADRAADPSRRGVPERGR